MRVNNLKIYEDYYRKNPLPTYEPFLEIIASLIKKRNIMTILDFGCGNGKVGAYLQEKLKDYCYQIDGIDLSPKALSLAKKYYHSLSYSIMAKNIKRKYDLVLLNSVIEHLGSQRLNRLFNRLEKITERLFIVIPNINSPRRLILGKKSALVREKEELGHVTFMSFGQIKFFLKKYGFNQIQSSFLYRFHNLDRLDYQIFKRLGFLKHLYPILIIFPFFFLKDSFWIYAEKRG